MAALAIPRRGNVPHDDNAMRLNLNRHETTYQPVRQVRTAREDTLQRQLSKVSMLSEGRHTHKEKSMASTALVSDDESLTFRSLPPIKVSIKQGRVKSNNKFMGTNIMESIDASPVEASGIFQPSYSMKTYRSGHHVFTEGISQSSTLPSPTFALKSIPVPYSNLPDSISIHKKKDTFAFGVRADDIDEEIRKSPYRLSEKPMGLANMDFMDYYVTTKGKNTNGNKNGNKNKITDKEPAIKDTTGFKCKLAAVEKAAKNEVVLDYPYVSIQDEVIDSYGVNESPVERKSRSPTKTTNRHPKERERSVSVVSIGDSVTPTYFDRAKRNTRKHYPMYDWKTSQNEALTKSKFGVRDVNCSQSNTNKPKQDKPKFDWSRTRLSTTLLEFDIDHLKRGRKRNSKTSKGKLHPIASNSKFVMSRQKTAGQAYESDPEFDLNKIYNMKKGRYQLRKLYPKFRKRFNRPSSNGSDSSTDMSTVIQNPPPSEISHSLMDDVAAYRGPEPKSEMVALMEERERTKTASAFSVAQTKGQTKVEIGKVTGNFENGIGPINAEQAENIKMRPNTNHNADMNENTARSHVQNTHEDLDLAAKITKEKFTEIDNGNPITSETIENKDQGTEQKVIDEQSGYPESDANDDKMSKRNNKENTLTDDSVCSDIYGFQKTRMISDFEKTLMEEYREGPSELREFDKQVKAGRSKSNRKVQLPVPTVSLNKLSHNPLLPYKSNSASLSRSLENLQQGVPVLTEREAASLNDGEYGDRKMYIPVRQIQMYSPPTSRSLITPAVSLTDEYGGYRQIFVSNENLQTDFDRGDKKLVSSTNIAFTSPLVTEPKAKRQ